MSWEAVTWASKQRMKLPHEQLILLVLANCADPNGEAFSKWPGREHWWKYLADRTRLSKSSLFRHINTLIELGLCTRSMMVLEDGTRRPTIRLDLETSFDIEDFEQQHSHERDQSHGETGDSGDEDEAETDNEIIGIEAENSDAPLQSHGETSPTGGTEPFPIVGMHKESSLDCSKESPPTPQAGGSPPDDGFEEFRKVWARPIERLSVAKSEWSRVPSAKHGEAITAARGYWAWLGKQTKPPPPVSAQTFLRESSGWAQWLAYAPDASGTLPAITSSYPLGTPEAKALIALFEIAGLGQFLSGVMIRSGAVHFQRPLTARIRALADTGPKDAWPVLSRQQAAAWEGFLRETVTVQIRKHLKEGDRAPWPWPPSAEGKIYATGPPEALMSEQDLADFK